MKALYLILTNYLPGFVWLPDVHCPKQETTEPYAPEGGPDWEYIFAQDEAATRQIGGQGTHTSNENIAHGISVGPVDSVVRANGD